MLRSLSQLKLYFWNPFFLTLTFLSDVGRSNHTDGLWSRKQSFWSISIPFWFHLTFKFSDVVNVLCFIHSQIQRASYTKCLNWLFLIIPKIDSNVFFFFLNIWTYCIPCSPLNDFQSFMSFRIFVMPSLLLSTSIWKLNAVTKGCGKTLYVEEI